MSALTPRTLHEARGQMVGLLETFRDRDPRDTAEDLRELARMVASLCALAVEEYGTDAEPEEVKTAILEYVVGPLEDALDEKDEAELEDPNEGLALGAHELGVGR